MSVPPAYPGFDREVPRDGYAWWYLDAIADDGHHGLTVIAFIGSVFSPYYVHARARGRGDPAHHCAVNVALYGTGGKRWALTERGRARLARGADHLQVGPSTLHWTGDALTIDVDEIAVPWPSRLRGRITVHPTALTGHEERLDAAGRHRWGPAAPRSRVEVRLSHPRRSWDGDAYLDWNAGDEPLEASFSRWDWSRCALGDGGAAVLYDPRRVDGRGAPLALRFDRHGAVEPFAAPPRAALAPAPVWRMPRATRCTQGVRPGVAATFEDTPFYARSLLRSRVLGEAVQCMHESLCLQRFRRPWVQALLPFRMPRRAG